MRHGDYFGWPKKDKCAVCGQMTPWFELNFKKFLCSEKCLIKMEKRNLPR